MASPPGDGRLNALVADLDRGLPHLTRCRQNEVCRFAGRLFLPDFLNKGLGCAQAQMTPSLVSRPPLPPWDATV